MFTDVQFRHKVSNEKEQLCRVAVMMQQVIPSSVQLIVNDHVDVAQRVEGAGVHLGAADMSPQQARQLLGAQACIGATANSLIEAQQLFDQPVDYLGVGPLFGTTSKANPAAALGLPQLHKIVAASPLPIIAIGGIKPQHVQSILDAGAHGIAILSGAVCQLDVVGAVRAYRDALNQAQSSPGAGLQRDGAIAKEIP